jgi:pyruvate formate lyase activating enzyme
MIHQAILSRSLHKGYVQCTACEHWCAVAPGEAGKCGVRRNLDGALQLVVYGRAIAANVDPVEKKPLHHFLPSQPIFSIGTVGCNFRCAWCQNWDISQYRSFDPHSDTIGRRLPPQAIVDHCTANDIPMVAYTYNEPVVFFEFAYDTAKLAHAAGLRNVFVTSGFETLTALETIGPYLDAVNVDLKAYQDQTYEELCGGRLAPVLRNIEHLVEHTGTWVEVTTLIVPDMNDSDEELEGIAGFLAGISPDIPWHVSGFMPHYQMQDRPPTSGETLRRAREIGQNAGLRFVYTGNIWGDARLRGSANTICPNCGAELIRRTGYQVQTLWTEPGVCHECGTEIAGVWN